MAHATVAPSIYFTGVFIATRSVLQWGRLEDGGNDAWSWPASFPSGVAATLNEIAAILMTACLVLGLVVLNGWRRPVMPCTHSAEALLREQNPTQIRRISMYLNVCLGTSMLLVAIGGLN